MAQNPNMKPVPNDPQPDLTLVRRIIADPMGVGKTVVRTWQAANSNAEAADMLSKVVGRKVTPAEASAAATYLRKQGIALKKMPRGASRKADFAGLKEYAFGLTQPKK